MENDIDELNQMIRSTELVIKAIEEYHDYVGKEKELEIFRTALAAAKLRLESKNKG